jgi:hypothetical protein
MQRPETIRAIAPVVDLTRQMEMVQNTIVPLMEMSRQMKAVQSVVAADMARQMKMVQNTIVPAMEMSRQMKAVQSVVAADMIRQMAIIRNVIGPALEMSRQMKVLQGAVAADMIRQTKMIRDAIGTLPMIITEQVRIIDRVREQVRRELEHDASRRGVTFDELLNAIASGVLIIEDPEELMYWQELHAWNRYEMGEFRTWEELFPHIPPERRFGVGFIEGSEAPFRPLFSGIVWGKKRRSDPKLN